MQKGSWNNSTVWSIACARIIVIDYEIFVSKKYLNPFNFVHDVIVSTKFNWVKFIKHEFVCLKNARDTVFVLPVCWLCDYFVWD